MERAWSRRSPRQRPRHRRATGQCPPLSRVARGQHGDAGRRRDLRGGGFRPGRRAHPWRDQDRSRRVLLGHLAVPGRRRGRPARHRSRPGVLPVACPCAGRRSTIAGTCARRLVPVLLRRGGDERALFVLAPQIGQADQTDHAGEASRLPAGAGLFVTPACLATVLLAATRGLGTMRANVLVEQVGRQVARRLVIRQRSPSRRRLSAAASAGPTRCRTWRRSSAALLWCAASCVWRVALRRAEPPSRPRCTGAGSGGSPRHGPWPAWPSYCCSASTSSWSARWPARRRPPYSRPATRFVVAGQADGYRSPCRKRCSQTGSDAGAPRSARRSALFQAAVRVARRDHLAALPHVLRARRDAGRCSAAAIASGATVLVLVSSGWCRHGRRRRRQRAGRCPDGPR